MHRHKASDFHPRLLELFDGYVHGALDRREFLDRAKVYAVGGMTAAALLETQLETNSTVATDNVSAKPLRSRRRN